MDNDTKEILEIIQEECAEVVVAISKIKRFGPDQVFSPNPLDEDTNMKKLEKELGDVQALVDLLIKKKVGVSKAGISKAKDAKIKKLKKWSTIKIN